MTRLISSEFDFDQLKKKNEEIFDSEEYLIGSLFVIKKDKFLNSVPPCSDVKSCEISSNYFNRSLTIKERLEDIKTWIKKSYFHIKWVLFLKGRQKRKMKRLFEEAVERNRIRYGN